LESFFEKYGAVESIARERTDNEENFQDSLKGEFKTLKGRGQY